jgi:hypothetical protein
MADAVVYRAMQDVQSAIVGSINAGTLVGLSAANVVIQKLATDRNQALPAVVISPVQEEMPPEGGVNDRDDITYNIVLALINNDNQNQTANFEQELNWRQNIRRLFHNQKLGPLTTENVLCRVKPLATVHRDAWYANLFLSLLVVEVICRETREPG